MLKVKFDKILILLALVVSALPARGQNEAYNSYSPYSMYGIGDISKFGTAYNKSMGGVGIATRDKRNINILNPACCSKTFPDYFAYFDEMRLLTKSQSC